MRRLHPNYSAASAARGIIEQAKREKPPQLTPPKEERDSRGRKILFNRRGDRVNSMRQAREVLMKEHGVTSGRQWKRLRKKLEREEREQQRRNVE